MSVLFTVSLDLFTSIWSVLSADSLDWANSVLPSLSSVSFTALFALLSRSVSFLKAVPVLVLVSSLSLDFEPWVAPLSLLSVFLVAVSFLGGT